MFKWPCYEVESFVECYTELCRTIKNIFLKLPNWFKFYCHERFVVDKEVDIAKGWSLYGEGFLSSGLPRLVYIKQIIGWLDTNKTACPCPISDDPGGPSCQTVLA